MPVDAKSEEGPHDDFMTIHRRYVEIRRQPNALRRSESLSGFGGHMRDAAIKLFFQRDESLIESLQRRIQSLRDSANDIIRAIPPAVLTDVPSLADSVNEMERALQTVADLNEIPPHMEKSHIGCSATAEVADAGMQTMPVSFRDGKDRRTRAAGDRGSGWDAVKDHVDKERKKKSRARKAGEKAAPPASLPETVPADSEPHDRASPSSAEPTIAVSPTADPEELEAGADTLSEAESSASLSSTLTLESDVSLCSAPAYGADEEAAPSEHRFKYRYRSVKLQCGMSEAEVQDILDRRTKSLRSQIAKGHFLRMLHRWRLRRAYNAVVRDTVTHVKLVLNTFVGVRNVLATQADNFGRVAAIALHFPSSQCGIETAQHMVGRRQDALAKIFSTTMKVLRWAFGELKTVSLMPDPQREVAFAACKLQKPKSAARGRAKRRLEEQKPWLFNSGTLPEEPSPARGFSPVLGMHARRASVRAQGSGNPVMALLPERAPTRLPILPSVTTQADALVPWLPRAPTSASVIRAHTAVSTITTGRKTYHAADAAPKTPRPPSRVPFVCTDCLDAKHRGKPLGVCRTTGCAVARAFTTVQRVPVMMLSPDGGGKP